MIHVPQILMNVFPTMEGVRTYVPIPRDLVNATVGLDTGLVVHVVLVRL